MNAVRVAAAVSLTLVTAAAAACVGDRGPRPEIASSAASVAYAEGYAEHLKALCARYAEVSKLARTDVETFGSFPDELGEVDWSLVEDLYQRADAAGRSRAVVETFDDARRARKLVDEHGLALSRRMSAHVNAVLKSRSCDCEFPTGPGTGRAIGDALDRELRDRYEELNDARVTLAARADDMADGDVSALEEQIDTLTETSFFVHVDAPRHRAALDRLLADADDVAETLERAIAAKRGEAEAEGTSKRGQKVARSRIEELEAARAPIEDVVREATKVRETLDDDILALQSAYGEAFDALLRAVRERQD